jgi:hypothetical protein
MALSAGLDEVGEGGDPPKEPPGGWKATGFIY